MYTLIAALIYFSAVTLCTGKCTTPIGISGVCVSIYKCPELLDALTTINDAQIKYVQKSQCGFKKPPMFCCPLKNMTVNSIETVPDVLPNKKYCGYQHFDDYFTFNVSRRANIDEFPWLASLMYLTGDNNISTECSGSLINDRFVLTTVQCTIASDYKLISVRLGEHTLHVEQDCAENTELEDCTDPVEEYGIVKVIRHPNFSMTPILNDIALLKLNRIVRYTDFIRPICLPLPGTKLAEIGEQVSTTGWGISSFKDPQQVNVKKKIGAELMSNEECKYFYRYTPRINVTEHHNCMLVKIGNQDFSCEGDTGAPVMFANKKQWHVEGLVSQGIICGLRAPVVNTNVTSYINWILDTIKSER